MALDGEPEELRSRRDREGLREPASERGVLRQDARPVAHRGRALRTPAVIGAGRVALVEVAVGDWWVEEKGFARSGIPARGNGPSGGAGSNNTPNRIVYRRNPPHPGRNALGHQAIRVGGALEIWKTQDMAQFVLHGSQEIDAAPLRSVAGARELPAGHNLPEFAIVEGRRVHKPADTCSVPADRNLPGRVR